jgi:predicted dehydrogenase
VIIASPADTHFDLAARALRAGCHVLVEKPLAATLDQADALMALAAGAGRVLQVGHLLRYSAEHRAIASRITWPLYIEATRIAPFKPRGTDVSVILDLMIHDLDLVLSLVDSDIAHVDAIGAAVSSPFEDIANARVRFVNGCVATITASRISLKTERKMRLFSEEGYCSADFGARKLTMIGSVAFRFPARKGSCWRKSTGKITMFWKPSMRRSSPPVWMVRTWWWMAPRDGGRWRQHLR